MKSVDIAQWLVALAAITSAAIAVAAAFIATHGLRYQRAQHAAAAIFDIVAREYLDRDFVSTEAPTIDGQVVTKTRPLKARAREALASEREMWLSEVQKVGSWQNRLAFEVSVALERLGVAVFSGSLPLRFLLPLAADQILEDWTFCAPWVAGYRENQKTYYGSIPFHRRYAEWLVLIAAAWMARHYPNYAPLREIQDMFGGNESIEKRLLERSTREGDTLDPEVRRELRALLSLHL